MPQVSRVVIRCTECTWSVRRLAAPDACEDCGASVIESTTPGPEPAPIESRRVELRARVLPSTALRLSARDAAEILDRAARRRA